MTDTNTLRMCIHCGEFEGSLWEGKSCLFVGPRTVGEISWVKRQILLGNVTAPYPLTRLAVAR